MTAKHEQIPQSLLENWEPGRAITESDLVAFERRTKLKLPVDYREFLMKVNGGRPPLDRSVFEGGIVNGMLSIRHEDDDFDIENRIDDTISRPPSKELLLIAYDDGGRPIYLCIRGDRFGEVWLWNTSEIRPIGSNPRVQWFERRDMWRLGASFVEFLRSLRPYSSIGQG